MVFTNGIKIAKLCINNKIFLCVSIIEFYKKIWNIVMSTIIFLRVDVYRIVPVQTNAVKLALICIKKHRLVI